MKVLVTGATGFIGSYILRMLLHQGKWDILALHRDNSQFDLVHDVRDELTWISADLDDLPVLSEIIPECDVVIHAAGFVSLDPRDRKKLIKVNAEGTATLINLCIAYDVNRFIHVSSGSALGKNSNGVLINEKSSWQERPLPVDYAFSKHLAETEVNRGQAEGLQTHIICPTFVLGGSFWDKGTMKIMKYLYNGMSVYPTGSIGVVDVRDVARMVVQILEQPELLLDKVICSNVNLSHFELFKKLAGYLNRPAPKRPIGKFMQRVLPLIAPFIGQSQNLTRQSVSISSANLMYDNSLSREELAFEYLPLEKTLKDCCDIFVNSYTKGRNWGILPI